MGEASEAERLTELEAAVTALAERVVTLEAHGLPARVSTLEMHLTRVERQLDLVFMQGQQNSLALGRIDSQQQRTLALLEAMAVKP